MTFAVSGELDGVGSDVVVVGAGHSCPVCDVVGGNTDELGLRARFGLRYRVTRWVVTGPSGARRLP